MKQKSSNLMSKQKKIHFLELEMAKSDNFQKIRLSPITGILEYYGTQGFCETPF